jgi:NAD(P)H-dependent FMN reductase
MPETMPIALILGSTREGRFCETVAKWAAARLALRSDVTVDVIDPLDFDLPRRLAREPVPAVLALRERLGTAKAFLVVTPEYNHGYTAGLKAVIDAAKAEWLAKPVGFVSYGGVSGGLRAVEQLRLVFAELHAVTIRDGVSFAMAWDRFDAAGETVDAEGPAGAMTVMVDQLLWWAKALDEAKAMRPYGKPHG